MSACRFTNGVGDVEWLGTKSGVRHEDHFSCDSAVEADAHSDKADKHGEIGV